ncbi:hypothetical protein TNCV_3337051 [Trichonephila clavipes]|nr:hypothetical protein TNCV_3337051 [Trichonephila clavipes]
MCKAVVVAHAHTILAAWQRQITARRHSSWQVVFLLLAIVLSTLHLARFHLSPTNYLTMPQRQYTFTNIHAFPWIRSQALRHSSQRH